MKPKVATLHHASNDNYERHDKTTTKRNVQGESSDTAQQPLSSPPFAPGFAPLSGPRLHMTLQPRWAFRCCPSPRRPFLPFELVSVETLSETLGGCRPVSAELRHSACCAPPAPPSHGRPSDGASASGAASSAAGKSGSSWLLCCSIAFPPADRPSAARFAPSAAASEDAAGPLGPSDSRDRWALKEDMAGVRGEAPHTMLASVLALGDLSWPLPPRLSLSSPSCAACDITYFVALDLDQLAVITNGVTHRLHVEMHS